MRDVPRIRPSISIHFCVWEGEMGEGGVPVREKIGILMGLFGKIWLKPQGFPRAKASGRPVGKAGGGSREALPARAIEGAAAARRDRALLSAVPVPDPDHERGRVSA